MITTMRLPRITIITPSLNQGAFIEQTIVSVLGQGYPDLEYMVIDGGSTDNTLDVLRRYAGQIDWRSEPDRGQSDAINKGLQRATGDIVAFLNSDDLYEPMALHTVGTFFAQHPRVAWATGKCRIIDARGAETRKAITAYKNAWLYLNSTSALHVLNYISQPATFWRRQVIDQVGGLNEDLHYALDYEYWLRMSQHSRPGVIKRYLSAFRVHSDSKGGTATAMQFAEELAIARAYTGSRLLRGLHRIHGAMIVELYTQMRKQRWALFRSSAETVRALSGRLR